MISREKLLEAAMRVFAESGFRGATTRRIAKAAGVNEVTLFRLFKSKSALINEAAQLHARRRTEHRLPDTPVDPEREVTDWCTWQLGFLHSSRALIRKCLAELEEHPEMAECMRFGPLIAQTQLRQYAARLCPVDTTADRTQRIEVACAMLQGALFADAMGRDLVPGMYPRPQRRAPVHYARAFLRLLGVTTAARSRANGNGRLSRRRRLKSDRPQRRSRS